MHRITDLFHEHKHELRPMGIGLAAIAAIFSPIWLTTLVTWGNAALGVVIFILLIAGIFVVAFCWGIGSLIIDESPWFVAKDDDED